MIDEIAIPIANTIARLFPHTDDNSPTLIASVLYRNEAICAGKAELYTMIFRLLGLDSYSSSISLTLDNDLHHTISHTTLLGDTKLIIDGNYLSKNKFLDKLNLFRKAIFNHQSTLYLANARAIRPKANVYLYTSRQITKEQFDQLKTHKYQLLTASGLTYYQADIPYPHQIITTSNFSNFSNSAHLNHANILTLYSQIPSMSPEEAAQQAQYHYQEAFRINPNDSLGHINYALLLENSWQLLGISQEDAMRQAKYHYQEALRINPNHASAHKNSANLLNNNWQSLGISQEDAMQQAEYHSTKRHSG